MSIDTETEGADVTTDELDSADAGAAEGSEEELGDGSSYYGPKKKNSYGYGGGSYY